MTRVFVPLRGMSLKTYKNSRRIEMTIKECFRPPSGNEFKNKNTTKKF